MQQETWRQALRRAPRDLLRDLRDLLDMARFAVEEDPR